MVHTVERGLARNRGGHQRPGHTRVRHAGGADYLGCVWHWPCVKGGVNRGCKTRWWWCQKTIAAHSRLPSSSHPIPPHPWPQSRCVAQAGGHGDDVNAVAYADPASATTIFSGSDDHFVKVGWASVGVIVWRQLCKVGAARSMPCALTQPDPPQHPTTWTGVGPAHDGGRGRAALPPRGRVCGAHRGRDASRLQGALGGGGGRWV